MSLSSAEQVGNSLTDILFEEEFGGRRTASTAASSVLFRGLVGGQEEPAASASSYFSLADCAGNSHTEKIKGFTECQ